MTSELPDKIIFIVAMAAILLLVVALVSGGDE